MTILLHSYCSVSCVHIIYKNLLTKTRRKYVRFVIQTCIHQINFSSITIWNYLLNDMVNRAGIEVIMCTKNESRLTYTKQHGYDNPCRIISKPNPSICLYIFQTLFYIKLSRKKTSNEHIWYGIMYIIYDDI